MTEMTPKERVLTCFEHKEPDRVPIWCGASEEFWEKAKRTLGLDDEGLRIRFGDDFRRIHAEYVGPEFSLQPGCKSCTVFGVQRKGMGYGQPANHPLANATLRELYQYSWPDPSWIDPSCLPQQAAPYVERYAILGGDWAPFWHDAMELVTMERLFVAMIKEPEFVDALFDHIVGYYFEVNRRIFEAASHFIDIFFIGNDFGTQNGPMIGPDLFERFVFPHLARLADLGHSYGLKVQLHCCGGFAPLIPLMIKAGIDSLHAVQPSCKGMDLRRLKQEFGDKIVFNGAIDSHHVLIKGTPQSVREATKEVLRIMMPGGGYVAGASHDSILEETPLENVLAMFDTVMEYGRYKNG